MFELCSIKSLNRNTYAQIRKKNKKLDLILECKVNIAPFWLHVRIRTPITMSNSMLHAIKCMEAV